MVGNTKRELGIIVVLRLSSLPGSRIYFGYLFFFFSLSPYIVHEYKNMRNGFDDSLDP